MSVAVCESVPSPVVTAAAPVTEREFVRSSGWALAARLCMAASRGVGLILLSRVLGATAFGEYSLLLAAFAVGSGVGTFGLDQAHVYFTGMRRQDAVRMLTNVMWLALVAGTAVGSALLGVVHLLRDRIFDGAPAGAVLATAIAMPAILHHNYVTGMVVGRSWFRYYGASEIAKWSLHVGILSTLAALDRLTVQSALLALYVPIVLAGIVHHVVLQRAERAPLATLWARPDVALLRQSLNFGARACLLTVGQVMHLRLDVYLVKYFTSAATVGQYALATNIADVILYAGRSVGLVLFARTAVDPRPTADLVPRITRIMSIVVCALAAIVALGRDVWIGTFFGPAYLACAAAIVCRLPGIVAESTSLVLVGDFLGRARALRVLAPTAGAVVVGLALNAWLVPAGGIAAAATAFSIASALRAGALVALHARLSGSQWYRYGIPTFADVRDIVRAVRRPRRWVTS
jgi:O-antigen/teichoic acid export membrane protein